jgi:hypothetical protein
MLETGYDKGIHAIALHFFSVFFTEAVYNSRP